MLQRIQSILLLLAGGAFFSLFKVNFATSDKSATGLFSDQLYNILDNPILIVMTVIGGGLALANIFLFRNRPLQLRLGYLIIVFCILLPLVAGLLMYNEGSLNAPNVTIEDGFGIYMPLLALVLTVLANRFIKKDNNLVKSMDRLR
jgi:hypothetical protein